APCRGTRNPSAARTQHGPPRTRSDGSSDTPLPSDRFRHIERAAASHSGHGCDWNSFPRPDRLSFFKERCDSLAKISSAPNGRILANGGSNLCIEFRAGVLGQELLCGTERSRAILRQLGG